MREARASDDRSSCPRSCAPTVVPIRGRRPPSRRRIAASQEAYRRFLREGFLTVSTTCVLGLLRAVLTDVKRPVTALRPILLDLAIGYHLLPGACRPPFGPSLPERRYVHTICSITHGGRGQVSDFAAQRLVTIAECHPCCERTPIFNSCRLELLDGGFRRTYVTQDLRSGHTKGRIVVCRMPLRLGVYERVAEVFKILRESAHHLLIAEAVFCQSMPRRPIGLAPSPPASIGTLSANERIRTVFTEGMKERVIRRAYRSAQIRLVRPLCAPHQSQAFRGSDKINGLQCIPPRR